MKHVPMRLGPIALLLTVVSICLSILAILAFTTARADVALAEKYAETVQTRYALEAQGQRFLATAAPLDEITLTEDDTSLTIALDESGRVCRWIVKKEWHQEDVIGGLWTGE